VEPHGKYQVNLPIYLDNNATTMMDPQVAQYMFELERQGMANPASQHRAGRQALRILEDSKCTVLQSLGAATQGMEANKIVLTSGGTEANNLLLRTFCRQTDSLAIIGAMEHPSLTEAAENKEICVGAVKYLPADSSGAYDLDRLADWVQAIYSGRDQFRRVCLVSLMLANNETGVLNDLKEIVAICQAYQVPVHSDIVQAVGKIPFDYLSSGVSAVTIAAHKIHGPLGIGALVLGSDPSIVPAVVGGGQQLGWRAGTEPVVLAAGMAKSLELAEQSRAAGDYDRVAQLRDAFENSLMESLDRISVNGLRSNRVPQTANLAFEGVDRQALQMALDLAGVACSTGSACSSGSGLVSTTLKAMGLSERKLASSLRFSLSRFTTAQEIDQAVERIVHVAQKQRRSQAAWIASS
jgi:cysteine desulfurase